MNKIQLLPIRGSTSTGRERHTWFKNVVHANRDKRHNGSTRLNGEPKKTTQKHKLRWHLS